MEPAASPVRLFMPLPALLGTAAGLVVLIILVVAMSVCLYRRRRKGSEAGSVAKTKKQNGTLVVSHHSTGSSIVGISPMRPTTSIPSHNGNGTVYEKVPTADDIMETRIDDDCHKASFEEDDFMMLMHGKLMSNTTRISSGTHIP